MTRFVIALSITVFLIGCQNGRMTWQGSQGESWVFEFAPAANTGDANADPLTAKKVESSKEVEDEGVSSGIFGQVSEVLLCSAGQQIQSFSVADSRESICVSIIEHDGDHPMRSDVKQITLDDNRQYVLTGSQKDTFFLDPTIAAEYLYYVSTAYGGRTLMRQPLDGKGLPETLTDQLGAVSAPDAGEDGIVYAREAAANASEILLIPGNGGRRQVIDAGSQPVWHQASRRVVFVSGNSICALGVDGNTRREVLYTASKEEAVKDPAISPDGGTLAFAKKTRSGGDTLDYDVWILPIGTQTPSQLTTLRSHDDMPAWLDDNTIAFRSTRGERWGVWKKSLGGKGSTVPTGRTDP